MTVLFTRPGNRRALVRNVSPTGENASTTCRFFFTLDTKKLIRDSGVSGTPADLASLAMEPKMLSMSSLGKRSGIQPLVIMPLM